MTDQAEGSGARSGRGVRVVSRSGAASFIGRALARSHRTDETNGNGRRNVRVLHNAMQPPQFYLTASSPCPYLPKKQERKVFTHLAGPSARPLNDLLTQGGFRRSQNIAYRPACDGCAACVSVRVVVDEFTPSRTQRRVLKRNADIVGVPMSLDPTNEQYDLFRQYVDGRHGGGGMAQMTVLDFAMMIEDTFVDTRVVEYRKRNGGILGDDGEEGELVGVALSDALTDGVSLVYSFFAPGEDRRSLGTYMILDHIARARAKGLPYVYLGYWVPGSAKMSYKARFQPQEHLHHAGWARAVETGAKTGD